MCNPFTTEFPWPKAEIWPNTANQKGFAGVLRYLIVFGTIWRVQIPEYLMNLAYQLLSASNIPGGLYPSWRYASRKQPYQTRLTCIVR